MEIYQDEKIKKFTENSTLHKMQSFLEKQKVHFAARSSTCTKKH